MYHGIKTTWRVVWGRQKITHKPLAPCFFFDLRKPHLLVFHIYYSKGKNLWKGFPVNVTDVRFIQNWIPVYLICSLEKILVLPLSSMEEVSIGRFKQDII